MEHPYMVEQINNIHQAEIRDYAAAQRLANSMKVAQPGFISRLVARFHRPESAVKTQDVLTTQEMLALNANRSGR